MTELCSRDQGAIESGNGWVHVMDTNKSYAGQVSRHLAIYAFGILAVLFLFIYALAFFAGTAGSSVNGNAINIERNSITIALSEEPPSSIQRGQPTRRVLSFLLTRWKALSLTMITTS